MRIIAGTHRGTLLTPIGDGDSAAHLRPTTDRVRENLFNILAGGKLNMRIAQAHVLDLFSGSGALGLEALSRGAAHVHFVENGKVALNVLRQNIAKLRRQGDCTVRAEDALKPLGALTPPATLVFADPPYGQVSGAQVLDAAHQAGRIAPGALIVWEDNALPVLPAGFAFCDQRRYGKTYLSFIKAPE